MRLISTMSSLAVRKISAI